ncbi:MAG TPA: hypothetical protein VHB27_16415 [Rhodopila sp.]|uniref:hypothetical protein n=1 Tax=Rhodopila sp. TaxID=2480087 RepID=UPI002BB4543E|nr:hypothetical protein [Rhodopila sp.]HVY16808.1 hypothetical protein [Rhodopila sp.]
MPDPGGRDRDPARQGECRRDAWTSPSKACCPERKRRRGDPDAARRLILAGAEAERFRDPARPHFPPGDLDIALDIDRYPFAIRVTMEDGRPVARMERAG